MKSLSRRTVFRCIAIALGCLPLLLLEAALRWLDIPTRSIVPGELSAIDRDPLVDLHSLKPLFVKAADGTHFKIAEERFNYFCPARFPVTKTSQTFRVFALGGSTTQGQPYRTETAFPFWLSLRLQAAMPDRNVEVVNCGGISYASYRVAAILDEVLTHSPDLIVLYTGHNEFLEARTYARQRQVPKWLARPLAWGADLQISRLLNESLRLSDTPATRRTALPTEVDTLLDHPEGMDAYQRDQFWIEGVEHHFDVTFRQMVRRCQTARVPLVVCLPASDLVNTPPFKSVPDPNLAPEQQARIEQLMTTIEAEATTRDKRLQAAVQILQIDPQHALANFVVGVDAYQENRDVQAARLRLISARDHDVCPLRATTSIEQTIQAVATEPGVYLVDARQILDQRDSQDRAIPDAIPDPHWFVDHVHPTIGGHQELATAIYRQLSPSLLKPVADAESTYQQAATAHLQGLGDEYYARAKQRLEGVNRWSRRIKPHAPR